MAGKKANPRPEERKIAEGQQDQGYRNEDQKAMISKSQKGKAGKPGKSLRRVADYL